MNSVEHAFADSMALFAKSRVHLDTSIVSSTEMHADLSVEVHTLPSGRIYHLGMLTTGLSAHASDPICRMHMQHHAILHEKSQTQDKCLITFRYTKAFLNRAFDPGSESRNVTLMVIIDAQIDSPRGEQMPNQRSWIDSPMQHCSVASQKLAGIPANCTRNIYIIT